jgi:hypothetical protein
MKTGMFVLFLLMTSASLLSSSEQCQPFVFKDISSEEWVCIQGKLREKGFTVGPGNTGEIAQSGMQGSFELLPKQQVLTISVRELAYSCPVIERAVTEVVDACRDFETVRKMPDTSSIRWRIDAPNIKKEQTDYLQIVFRRGDTVTVTAGGCVQHGGPGKTWSLYVDPKPSRSPYFYGMIRLPGMTAMTRIKEIVDKPYPIPKDAIGSMFLKLGFTDFRFTDNGYWGRQGDDGIDEQCKDQPNAWVQIEITR